MKIGCQTFAELFFWILTLFHQKNKTGQHSCVSCPEDFDVDKDIADRVAMMMTDFTNFGDVAWRMANSYIMNRDSWYQENRTISTFAAFPYW